MISVLIGVLGLFFPVLASAAGADLKSVERSDHAIMIVLPQALDETGPRRLKDGDCDNGPWLSRGGRRSSGCRLCFCTGLRQSILRRDRGGRAIGAEDEGHPTVFGRCDSNRYQPDKTAGGIGTVHGG
jgi:hypothetical protein